MKNIIRSILIAAAAIMVTGCDDNAESIAPAMISNLQAEPMEGAVLLKWNNPTDGDYFYSQVQYEDLATGELLKTNASSHTNECLISGLFRKYGDYTFKVYTVSSTDTFSSSYEEIKAMPLAAPPTYVQLEPEKVTLSVDMLSSNASDPSEGNLSDIIDGNPSTFWHSNWHTDIPFPHYIQIDLDEEVAGVKFKTTNRAQGGYGIGAVEILGSNDGENWTEIGNVPTGRFPTASGAEYTTDAFSIYPQTQQTFSKIRFNVLSVPSDHWCIAEFEMWKISYEIVDPEG